MRAWIDHDATGASFLVRVGRGRVTSVSTGVDVIELGTDNRPGNELRGDGWPNDVAVVVEIEVARDLSSPRAVRMSVSGRVDSGSALAQVAQNALDCGASVEWVIEWHRKAHVPSHVAITDLDVATDAVGYLKALDQGAPVVTDHEFAEIANRLSP